MNVTLSGDQILFRDTTRRFLEAETPVASLRRREDDPDGFDRGWWKRGAQLGWTAMLVPEEDGGGNISGQGVLDLAMVAEEMGRVVAPGALVPINVVASALVRSGSIEQRALLPSIASGETLAAWAMYEPGGGWRSEDVRLEATAEAGEYVLNGTKSLVEAGNVADHFLVVARRGAGISQFLVPRNAQGLAVTNETSLDLGRRYATLQFSGVKVPPSAVVGTPNGAADDVQHQLELAAVLQVAETCGALSRVFEFTLDYLGDRHSFGRPLSSYQALKHRVADLKMSLEASLGVAALAAAAVQEHDPQASSVVSAAKAYVGERATDGIQDCVQLHGGIGVTWEHDLHLYLRRATVNRFTYGTPEEHRERLVALAGI